MDHQSLERPWLWHLCNDKKQKDTQPSAAKHDKASIQGKSWKSRCLLTFQKKKIVAFSPVNKCFRLIFPQRTTSSCACVWDSGTWERVSHCCKHTEQNWTDPVLEAPTQGGVWASGEGLYEASLTAAIICRGAASKNIQNGTKAIKLMKESITKLTGNKHNHGINTPVFFLGI